MRVRVMARRWRWCSFACCSSILSQVGFCCAACFIRTGKCGVDDVRKHGNGWKAATAVAVSFAPLACNAVCVRIKHDMRCTRPARSDVTYPPAWALPAPALFTHPATTTATFIFILHISQRGTGAWDHHAERLLRDVYLEDGDLRCHPPFALRCIAAAARGGCRRESNNNTAPAHRTPWRLPTPQHLACARCWHFLRAAP